MIHHFCHGLSPVCQVAVDWGSGSRLAVFQNGGTTSQPPPAKSKATLENTLNISFPSVRETQGSLLKYCSNQKAVDVIEVTRIKISQ